MLKLQYRLEGFDSLFDSFFDAVNRRGDFFAVNGNAVDVFSRERGVEVNAVHVSVVLDELRNGSEQFTRRAEIAKLAIPSLVSGTLAAFITACLAALFI